MDLCLLICREKVAKIRNCLCNLIFIRQHDDAEMIRLFPGKAASWDNHHMLGVQIIHRKLLVIGNMEALDVELGENIKTGVVFDEADSGDFFQFAAGRFADRQAPPEWQAA